MGIAPLTLLGMIDLFTPLQSLAGRWMPTRRRLHRDRGLRYVAIRPSPAGRTSAPVGARPPRVVRMIDAPRVVLSGRMADVCAELDRLAALEAGDAAPPRARLH